MNDYTLMIWDEGQDTPQPLPESPKLESIHKYEVGKRNGKQESLDALALRLGPVVLNDETGLTFSDFDRPLPQVIGEIQRLLEADEVSAAMNLLSLEIGRSIRYEKLNRASRLIELAVQRWPRAKMLFAAAWAIRSAPRVEAVLKARKLLNANLEMVGQLSASQDSLWIEKALSFLSYSE